MFLEQKMMCQGYFWNMNAFLRVNVTFYDVVNMVYGVIRRANLFPYTAKFMLVGVRNDTTQQIRRLKIEYVHSVVVCQKCLTRLEEMMIFSPRFENYQFSQSR